MRGKDYNAGLRGVLFEAQHYRRMGSAIWLFGWLVLRQTRQSGSIGWVLGGAPINYREIEQETGFNVRTLEKWMGTLRRQGYIETEKKRGGIVVRIKKAKKFPHPARYPANAPRYGAGNCPPVCVLPEQQSLFPPNLASGIRSSFVERLQGSAPSPENVEIHRDFHSNNDQQSTELASEANPFWVRENEMRRRGADGSEHLDTAQIVSARERALALHLRRELLRAERDEAIRRELRVGTGPEVPRS